MVSMKSFLNQDCLYLILAWCFSLSVHLQIIVPKNYKYRSQGSSHCWFTRPPVDCQQTINRDMHPIYTFIYIYIVLGCMH